MTALRKSLATALALVMAISATVLAQADAPGESMITANNLDRLSFSVSVQKQIRPLKAGNETWDLESRDMWGEMSLDVTDWFTVGGGAGQTEVKQGQRGPYTEGDLMWTVGAKLNMIEHEITKPGFMASVVRIQAAVSHWESEAEIEGTTVEWEELRGELTVRAEVLVKEPGTYDEPIPYSAVFYAGPVYSEIDGKAPALPPVWTGAGAMEFHEENDMGVEFGVEVNLARNLSIGWETRLIDETTHTLSLALHL